ncbi:MAG: (d)CMP kinase, partial [Spirochaetota bacterium]
MKTIIVAVDGPAGSGKSSVSKIAAVKAGLKYIDSGAIYRSVTWYMLEKYGEVARGRDYGAVALSEMKI